MSIRPFSTAEEARLEYQYSPSTPTVVVPLPPPPPRDGRPPASPLRPGHVPAPPPLNVNVASVRGLSIQSPVSAPALHGPLSPTYLPSPVPSPRSAYPMATRLSSNYNAPYNPREWVGGSRRTSLVLDGRHSGAQAEDGIPNPPPPYSAASAAVREATSAGSTVSPADSTFTAGNNTQTNTPTSTVGVRSPLQQGSGSLVDGSQNVAEPAGSQYFAAPPGRTGNFDPRPSRLSISSQQHGSRPASSLSMTRPVVATALSINTAAAQQSMAPPPVIETHHGPIPAPPASRRAASTGAVSSHSSSIHSYEGSSSRSSSKQRNWQPGMPLPGPPPGPPPSSSRSQSTGGVRALQQPPAVEQSGSRPTHRTALRAPLLSPMPPTPANWREQSNSRSSSRAPVPLHIETSNLDQAGSLPAGLSRSAALRVTSAKGLLERRKQRRSLHEGQVEDLSALTIETDPWFDGMSPTAAGLEQSPTMEPPTLGRASPETARRGLRTTSRSRSRYPSFDRTPTPVDSPYPPGLMRKGSDTPLIPSKALPTPPLSQKNPASAHSVLPSTASSISDLGVGEYDAFMLESSRRHHDFLLKESQAGTELEKLQIFMDYIVKESKLRRQHYPGPFSDGTFNAEGAKQLFFKDEVDIRPAVNPRRRQSPMQAMRIDPPQRSDTLWSKEYRPELSPIASMSNDDLSSRGRTASRWWQSQTGSEADGVPKKLKRTKRESKYMGVSALSMHEVLSEAATPTNLNEVYSTAESYPDEKANPETFGFYDNEEPIPVQDSMSPNVLTPMATPMGFDISRFITLPPPYPRHYPAVNNNHPKLSIYRTLVRTLSDLSELQTRRSRQSLSVEALRSEHKRKVAGGQQNFRANIATQIHDGSITYAEAAEAEQALRVQENESEKACLKAEFDTLQDVVINPMHEMLNDRASQLSTHISGLTEQLVAETNAQNLDRPQQEGDAVPEILEYLTQLKWLFETRETIHKEIFDLLTARNDKYKAIVLLPYHQNNNMDKIRDTEGFFARDAFQRHKDFYEEAVMRYQAFANLVAKNVDGEVELQSSAFWDIAPGLLDLLQRIPDELERFGPIAIPETEYVENPAYHEFPQQYLYTLLDHAEKSTYQFIESQTNLHCLLHEVKLSLLTARCRAAEAGRARDELDGPVSGEDPNAVRKEQEAAATAELKQQVAMIEEQWLEALGSVVQGKKMQVRQYLESVGGWDESIQE
ncbi:hypothetical protein H2200_006601 [Cladophialophora chaetospira]|uniref:Uncharacterized protein n=1 Tax=Cladophialophora chaetospira TaxID=386627 RepID=A0AA38X8N1_9EURO|nr:hypothetical protein H2200_006601 [Cladophialophora chaetospira]